MERAKLTSKGQVTIPKAIRDGLNLKAGDELVFTIVNDNLVARPRNKSIRDLHGILHRPGQRAVGIEEMNQTIRQAILERHDRSR